MRLCERELYDVIVVVCCTWPIASPIPMSQTNFLDVCLLIVWLEVLLTRAVLLESCGYRPESD